MSHILRAGFLCGRRASSSITNNITTATSSVLSCREYSRSATGWLYSNSNDHHHHRQISGRGNRLFATDAAHKSTNTTSISSSGNGCFDAKDETEILSKLKNSFDCDAIAGNIIPVYKRALIYGNKIAIKDQVGEYSYGQLFAGAKKLSLEISKYCEFGSKSKIAFLCSNTALFTIVQWACWMSGHIAVPLSNRHPTNVLDYYVKDSNASLLITTAGFENIIQPLAEKHQRKLIVIDHNLIPAQIEPTDESNAATGSSNADTTDINQWLDPKLGNIIQQNGQLIIPETLENSFYTNSDAMILYTSGSTGPPKGTVLTHKNLTAQVNCLTEAWQLSKKDSFLHVLPLNHVHGCVNGQLVPLSIGAKLFMLPKFDSSTVWSILLNINMPSKDRINVFQAVPTIYSFLIAEYDKVFSKNSRMVDYIRAQCEQNIRLMISGSGSLPTPIFKKWQDITGHKLLERYGMTEIGMALSNPYVLDKNRNRLPSSVGYPLPSVEVKLVNANNETIVQVKGESAKGVWCEHELPIYEKTTKQTNTEIPLPIENNDNNKKQEQQIGELYIRGPSVFKEYLNKPEETQKTFTKDGWFVTGDEVLYENGQFHILGRKSVDIIKAGGYKISALAIETRLLEIPGIVDVCIVGIPDPTWGQKIAVIVVPAIADESLAKKDKVTQPIPVVNEEIIKKYCHENLASYEIPSVFKFIKELPRNPMGKINKKEILKEYFAEETKTS